MNKKELIALLILPLISLCITYYGVYQIDAISSKHLSNVNNVKKFDYFVTKIKSETPETTQNNLISYVKNVNNLLIMEHESEALYIEILNVFFRNTLMFSSLWVMFVLFIYYKINKRNIKQNL